jgi:uncharacterized repeat protein (TIGR03943 family)
MNQVFSRWMPAATLASWSSILLYFYFTGRITAFLVPMFRPYVLVAGIVMALMALTFLFVKGEASSCCDTSACGHSLSRFGFGKLLTFGILLLPVTTAAFFSPDAFGKTAVLNRGIITDAAALGLPSRDSGSKPYAEPPLPTKDGSVAPPAPESTGATAGVQSTPPAPAAQLQSSDYLQYTPEGNIVAEVLDLLYAAQDNSLRADFEGKKVELVGQLMPDKTSNASGRRFKAVRMFMTCCAADARPVATVVETPQQPDLPEMTWVRIVGEATFPLENGRRIAVLQAETVEKTNPPEESMLY